MGLPCCYGYTEHESVWFYAALKGQFYFSVILRGVRWSIGSETKVGGAVNVKCNCVEILEPAS